MLQENRFASGFGILVMIVVLPEAEGWKPQAKTGI